MTLLKTKTSIYPEAYQAYLTLTYRQVNKFTSQYNNMIFLVSIVLFVLQLRCSG